MTTRREVLEAGIAAGTMMTLGTLGARAQERPLILKKIPSTGEELPPVGIGTNRYGVGTGEAERAPLRATLERFAQLGGKVVDTAPIYGTSESVIGDLVSELGIRDKLFLATKTDITGRTPAPESMRQSAQRLRTDVIDLMQVHNLVKVQESLAALRDWKAGGRIRYIGVTISTEDQFDELEQVMRRETL
ncbi:MAG TPA: aldo/keto reductase, partial [Gammaproteobacteria bacterium]